MFFPLHDDNPTRRVAVVTYAIIVVNVLVFLWLVHLPAAQRIDVVLRHGFMPARVAQLSEPVPLVIPQKVPVRHPVLGVGFLNRQVTLPPDRGEILSSLLSCMFMHGGWWHLIGNMWFLWIFGTNVEDRLGRVLFLFFYLVGGLLATAMHWAIEPGSVSPIIGASGAVAAVLGAYAITWPWARVRVLVFLVIFITVIDVPALLVLGIWFLVQLSEGHAQIALNTAGGVAWWAHVGGFLAGLVLMPLLEILFGLDKDEPPRIEIIEEEYPPW